MRVNLELTTSVKVSGTTFQAVYEVEGNRLELTSPPGGPTEVEVWLPCAS